MTLTAEHRMQLLSARIDLAAFYSSLAHARHRVLMLDYDGTLAPFRIRPEQAVPYPGVADALRELMARGDTRVVIVSGRRVAEVAALLPLKPRPEIWGAHGWERALPDGELRALEPGPAVREALSRAASAAGPLGRDGMRIELKPASVAFHWRGAAADAVAVARGRLTAAWRPIAADGALELMPFDGGLELRARGTNKQHAVTTVLAETPSECPAAYLGDDMTDEDAFAAVKARGLAVLVRPEYRQTGADVWLKPPEELLGFIEYWRAPARR